MLSGLFLSDLLKLSTYLMVVCVLCVVMYAAFCFLFVCIFSMHCCKDTMENWDEAKLQDVVTQKHGESDKSKPKTDIVSIF